MRSVINIGRDARNVINSRRQEREREEAYSPTSNYRIPDDYPRSRKHQHLRDDREATCREEQREKMQAAQDRFNQALRGRCKWHPKVNHSTYECKTLRKALGAPPL